MHANLALEIAISHVAFHAYGHALDAGLVALDEVLDGGLVAVTLTPAQVHAHEHLRPVLALGAAGTRIDFENGVHLVLVATQHVAQF